MPRCSSRGCAAPVRAQPEKLRDTLGQMRNYDLGQVVISYSPTNHVGTGFVDINIISSSGKLLK